MRPSFLAHIVNALFLLLGLLYAGYYVWKNYDDMTSLELGELFLLISLAVGVHGLIHVMEEVYFDFNPLIGANKIYNHPVRQ